MFNSHVGLLATALRSVGQSLRYTPRGAPLLVLVPVPVEELPPSAWDPEEIAKEDIAALVAEESLAIAPIERTPYKRRTEYETELLVQEIEGCKNLLMELVRRSSFDWVLYRTSTRLVQKQLAEQAYTWLFVEGPGHPDWQEREREGKVSTSFIAVCAALDLEPDSVRKHLKQLTPAHAVSVGRPSNYKHRAMSLSGAEDDSYDAPEGLPEFADVSDSELY